MTDAQKLEALVRRAVENKWKDDYIWEGRDIHFLLDRTDEFETTYGGFIGLIFNHDFARALFGELLVCPMTGYHTCDGKCKPKFENELQQAVISEDPIDYMHKAVFGDK